MSATLDRVNMRRDELELLYRVRYHLQYLNAAHYSEERAADLAAFETFIDAHWTPVAPVFTNDEFVDRPLPQGGKE